jgi:UPF0755 protein
LGLLVAAVAALVGGAMYLNRWSQKPHGAPGRATFEIEKGASLEEISDRLENEDWVNGSFLFRIYAASEGKATGLQAGQYAIERPISPQDLLARLQRGSFRRRLTIPEGWTSARIEQALLEEGWIDRPGDWLEVVREPLRGSGSDGPEASGAEGLCFPDTYYFEAGVSAAKIRDHLVRRFEEIWAGLDPDRRDSRSESLSILEVVTLASVVERETRRAEELPMIASVFLNRLKKGMKLQSCATVHYALGEVWDRKLTYADLEVDSPYNTYIRPGLPVGPIGNPGRAAIEAVLRPAPTEDLYFVHRGDGSHEFTRTYAEHQRAARRRRLADPHAGLVKE